MRIWETDVRPEDQQFAYWREVLCEAFVSLDPVIKPNDQPFLGRVSSHDLYQTAQTQIFSRGQFINRRWEEIRRNPVEYCFANFQLEGSCVVRQDGQETLVSPGGFAVVDSTRPYYLDFREDWRVLSFRIPRSQLISRLASPRQAMARAVDGKGGLGLVASRFACSLERINTDTGIDAQEGLSTALNSVIAITLGATLASQEGDRQPVREAFRRAIETYISDHLADPLLSPNTIAMRFGVSRRTLYGLFEDSALSVSGLIREQRLLRSARDLQSPACRGVLAVAMRWGFNDASHYSRIFKKRFGVSPREFASRQ
ncbi:helix-turn-helix domain-containing protein [Paraburkholderia heleia]|uniref:helix-turn-helix domain-containing protein n=1 Tax=Paraburkholderia heleia TaxID=634127 RepID=UPI0005A93948|nr:helix-turn-helix domain-containing protein [Paraburkholderia heleia]